MTAPLPTAAPPPGGADAGAWPLDALLDGARRLQDAGRADVAAALFDRWLAVADSPQRHVAAFHHGNLLARLQRDPEAEAAWQRALALQPQYAQARMALGHALERRGDLAGALAQWERVAAQTRDAGPDRLALRLQALNHLARLNEQARCLPAAQAWLRESLTARAAQPDVLPHYVHLRQQQCEWPLYAPVAGVTPQQLQAGTSPLAMLGTSDDPVLQQVAARRFVQARVPAPPAQPLHALSPPRAGRIRIGYLSGDLCMHAVGMLCAELLALHDRDRFEVHGYCWSREDGSPLRERLVQGMDHLVRIAHMDDNTAARVIASHGIDVLIDLQGLTHGARPNILVQRPAPVQISYLGLPGTCALPGVDWIIADRFVMPEALLPHCSEKPIYLPHCFQVSDRQREVGPAPTRAGCALPEDAFVFCAFSNNFKITERGFAGWMRILQAVPGSVLWLLADNDGARENLARAADAQGVGRDRLVFAPRVAPPDYLARFALADLMLDTFPYNAGTTANDALWMGLPIVTCAGRSFASRMAGSLLMAVGLPELVTGSPAEFEALAIRLGNDRARVASLKRHLAGQGRASALFDVPAIVRAIEDAVTPLALAARAAQAGTASGRG